MKLPDVTVDCPRCGFAIHVAVEAGTVQTHIGDDGKAEASIQIRGIPLPHVCKDREPLNLEATA